MGDPFHTAATDLFRLQCMKRLGTAIGVENEITPIFDELRQYVHVGAFEFLFPERVRENARALDLDMRLLDKDVTTNITKRTFLDGWAAFLTDWRAYLSTHTSSSSIVLHGTGAVWRQIEDYRARLNRWWEAAKLEIPNASRIMVMKAPSIPGSPTPDQKPELPFWTTERVILATLVGSVLLAGAGYGAYYFIQEKLEAKRRFERIMPAVLPAIGGSAGAGAAKAITASKALTFLER